MTAPRYPATRTVDQVDDYHGTKVADPYRWLEADNPEVREWIAGQNRLTRGWLDDVPARAALRDRLAQLWDHPRTGVPWRRGERWFQLRNSGLQNQDVLYTWVEGSGDDPRVLLDPNGFSQDGTVALSGLATSPDGARLAYATSASGSDWMTWHVCDTGTGADLGDVVPWSKFSSASWTPDGSGFYYGRYAEPEPGQAYEQVNRNQRLRFHRVGTGGADALVYERPDQPEWGFDPHVTFDGRYLVVHVWHGTDPRNRVFYRAVGDTHFTELLADGDAAYDFVGNDGPLFYFVTDADAPRGRVIAVDLSRPQRPAWREIVREADLTDRGVGSVLQAAEIVGGRLVCVWLRDAHHQLTIHELDGTRTAEVTLPGPGSVEVLRGTPEHAVAHFGFTSFAHPPSVHWLDVRTGETGQAWAESPGGSGVPGLAVDADDYVTEQVFVASRDGTRIPMFLTRRRDLGSVLPDENGTLPTLLYGYGGFNIPLTPAFRVAWLVWLELGGVLAVANLRGGGEYGKAWHDGGRLARKQNVFDDAQACAEWLVAQGWTSPERLAVQGGSNGGLLVGACLTQRPDLFGAAVAEVGVLDMLRFHHFTIGWAWVSDYGSPADPDQFSTLYAYSPLHNLQPGTRYPPTLITTGDHDDRVVPAHSFKFTAALQAAQGGDAPILARIQTAAGHGAGKPTTVLIDERADVLAFLVRTLAVPVG